MHEQYYGQKLQESTHYVRTPEGMVALREQQPNPQQQKGDLTMKTKKIFSAIAVSAMLAASAPAHAFLPPLPLAIAAGLIAGEAVDIGISTALGGEGKTISYRTAKAREEGSALAAAACATYTPVLVHDVLRFSAAQLKWMKDNRGISYTDHCGHRLIAEGDADYAAAFPSDHTDDWDDLNR